MFHHRDGSNPSRRIVWNKHTSCLIRPSKLKLETRFNGDINYPYKFVRSNNRSADIRQEVKLMNQTNPNGRYRALLYVRGKAFFSKLTKPDINPKYPNIGPQYSISLNNPQIVSPVADPQAAENLQRYFFKDSDKPEYPGQTFATYLQPTRLNKKTGLQEEQFPAVYDLATNSQVLLPQEIANGEEITVVVQLVSSDNAYTVKNGNFTTYLQGVIVDNFSTLKFFTPGGFGLEGFQPLSRDQVAQHYAQLQNSQASASQAQPTQAGPNIYAQTPTAAAYGQPATPGAPVASPFGQDAQTPNPVAQAAPAAQGVVPGTMPGSVPNGTVPNPFGQPAQATPTPDASPFGQTPTPFGAQVQPSATQPSAFGTTPQQQAPANPFGGAPANPFGGATPQAQAPGTENPFAGTANPFAQTASPFTQTDGNAPF